eukprot:TRINITY_DN3706_c0_g1_i4.p1 TRINITY_DN3706_c0_g1~~TRINITY_DN3706_c0_g1_i4.p1  ORF type:complete len:1300 (-),score=207.83 TRINITY_DN3706_c0_g1_i4:1330-5229(-)
MSDAGAESSSMGRSQSLPLNRGGSGGSENSPVTGNMTTQDLQMQYILSLVNLVRSGSHKAKSHREKCSQVLGAIQLAYSALEWYAQSESHQQLPRYLALVQKDLEVGNMLVQVYGQHGAFQKATTMFSRSTIRQKFDQIIDNLDRIANEIWQVREYELQDPNEARTSATGAPHSTRTLTTTNNNKYPSSSSPNYVNSKNLTSCRIYKGHYRNLVQKWLFSTRCTTSMAFVPSQVSDLGGGDEDAGNQGVLWWVHNNCIYQHDIGDESTKEISRPEEFQGVIQCMAVDSDRGVIWLGSNDGKVAVFNDTRGEVIAPTVSVGKGQVGITAITVWQGNGGFFGLLGCDNGAVYSYRLDQGSRSSRCPCVLNKGKQLSILPEELDVLSSTSNDNRQKSVSASSDLGSINQNTSLLSAKDQRQTGESPNVDVADCAGPESQSETPMRYEEIQMNGGTVIKLDAARQDLQAGQSKALRAHKGQVHSIFYHDRYAWTCGGVSHSDCCIRLWQDISPNVAELTFKLVGQWSCGQFGPTTSVSKIQWPPLPTNPQQFQEAIQCQDPDKITYRILTGHENGQLLMWSSSKYAPLRPVLVIGEPASPVRGLVVLSDLGIVAVGHASGALKLRRLSHKLDKFSASDSPDNSQGDNSQYSLSSRANIRPKTAELHAHKHGMLFCVGSRNTIVTSGWFGNVRLFPEVYLRNELEREKIPILPIQGPDISLSLSNSMKDVSRLLRHMTPTTQRLMYSIQQQLSTNSDGTLPSSPGSDSLRSRRAKAQFKPQLGTINSDIEFQNSSGSNNLKLAANDHSQGPSVDVSDPPSADDRESSFSTQPSNQPIPKMTSKDMDLYNEFLVDYDDLKFLSELGDGSFGRVHKALLDETVVAVKILQAQFLGDRDVPDDGPDDCMYNLFKEVSVLHSIRHPNVVNFMGLCRSPPCLITEFCERGSLFDVLQEYRREGMDKVSTRQIVSWHRRIQMLLHAARGMLTLHRHKPPIVHRDLKSPNLLVAKDWTVKVADFNLSRFLDTSTVVSKAEPNNPLWQAPEVIKGGRYTRKTDVYAFGIIMWEVMTALPPWGEDVHYFAVMQALINDDARPDIGPELQILGGDWKGQAEYLELMQQCWGTNPQERPDFIKIAQQLNHLDKLAQEWEVEQTQTSSSFRNGSSRALEFQHSGSNLASAQMIQEQIYNQQQQQEQGRRVTFADSSFKNNKKNKSARFYRSIAPPQPQSDGEDDPSVEEDYFASPFEGQEDFAQSEETGQAQPEDQNNQNEANQTGRQMSQQDSISALFGGGNPFAATQEIMPDQN